MAKKSSLQIKAEYAAVRALFIALGVLPRRVCLAVCRLFLRAGYYLIAGLRRTGMRNLEIAFPEKTLAERREILKGTFDNLGRVLGEMSQFHKSTPESLARIIDLKLDETAQNVYDRHDAEGRGVMMVTGHFGNWELLVMAFAAIHEPISYLARPLDNPMIDEMTARIRSRFGNVPIDKNNSAITAIKILSAGGGLGILADVNVHPKEGIFVPFFGVPACTSIGPAMIAARSNALIFPTFCVWDKARRIYRLVHGRVIEPPATGDRQQDTLIITTEINKEIEKVIRAYPHEWLWIHKRWKTRPPGEASLY
ncbi:MAG: lysophospholipid acyltransferase family protein [Pyrinomonadaceae bacterium]|nr:lysophospholipid acyltransferase family protein [Pyrinomonadaceae bacterium]